MDKIIKVLKNNDKVSAWKINAVTTKSTELFYVLDKLETTRGTDVTEYRVTIYADKDGKRGSAAFAVYEYMDEAELAEKIENNLYALSFAMNEYYDIPSPENVEITESKSNLKDRPFTEIAEDVVRAVFAADTYKEGYLSATEFFLSEKTERVVNSNGVDVSAKSYSGRIELIPSWEKGDEEVEIYHMAKFESFDAAAVTAEVDEHLRMARDRFEAKNISEVNVPDGIKVLLQNDEAGRVFGYFVGDLQYNMKYQKANKFEVGQNLQGNNVTGDRLNIKLVPYYENAMASRAFDSDGVVLKEVSLVEDGIAKAMWGTYRFGYYLGEKRPTGDLPVVVVTEGTKSFKDMTKEPYIRCAVMSGIQVESRSGYFGGEVRLGYYYDGEKEIPITGFSISGNMNRSAGTMVYSSETYTSERYHGPKYLEITDMKVM